MSLLISNSVNDEISLQGFSPKKIHFATSISSLESQALMVEKQIEKNLLIPSLFFVESSKEYNDINKSFPRKKKSFPRK